MSSSVITQQSTGLATETQSGLVSTDTQSFAGDKTFVNIVFQPQQPIISGQMGSAMLDPASPQKLAFNEFWVSRGITYDSVNRRFIVPVAGVYRITLNPFFIQGVASGRVLVGVNTDAPTVTNHYGHAYRQSAEYETGCINSIVSLNANDYIVFYLASGSLYNQTSDKFNQFSIELIG